jgi:hypothetical protein
MVTKQTSIVLELQVTGYRAKQHTVTSYTPVCFNKVRREEVHQSFPVRGTGEQPYND